MKENILLQGFCTYYLLEHFEFKYFINNIGGMVVVDLVNVPNKFANILVSNISIVTMSELLVHGICLKDNS